MKYTIQIIRENLATNQKWVEGAILKLYEFQTQEEQQAKGTFNPNGKGFNAMDARTLSYYATFLKTGRHLSGKHLDKAFKMVPKYAGQILNSINMKAEQPTITEKAVMGEKPLHQQLRGWDGYGAKGQAIYDAIGEQQEREMQAYESLNAPSYEEVKACQEVEDRYGVKFGEG